VARDSPVDGSSEHFYATAKKRIPLMTLMTFIREQFFDQSSYFRGRNRAIGVDEAE
jgi:hypothetical protein